MAQGPRGGSIAAIRATSPPISGNDDVGRHIDGIKEDECGILHILRVKTSYSAAELDLPHHHPINVHSGDRAAATLH